MHDHVRFSLAFHGGTAEEHAVDLYDVSQALIGFQRSLALTVHLVLNGQIITQSPSLKGAKIYALRAEPGSWGIRSLVVMGSIATGLYHLGSLQNNSPLGHLVFSLYDYVVSESIGVHVDFNKSIGQLYEQAHRTNPKLNPVTQTQADSLIEKCDTAIREMHRPIFMSKTAESASITCGIGRHEEPLHTSLTLETYDFIHETHQADVPEVVQGRISSYNANTFKGRIYVPKFGRPISFELSPKARTKLAVRLITSSLHLNAIGQRVALGSVVSATVLRNTSKTGNLKRLTVLQVAEQPLSGT
jgi:hypothetical protein